MPTAMPHARARFGLAGDAQPDDSQLNQVEFAAMQEALRPFLNPALRKAILAVLERLEQVIADDVQDHVTMGGDMLARLEDLAGNPLVEKSAEGVWKSINAELHFAPTTCRIACWRMVPASVKRHVSRRGA